ncbi:MAG: hypothetical protein LBM70_04615 [Victivallales bacterium]|jgi:Zn finger protein HypA/HybF involved in hydrogenase expression|nr:hypothetical protein [Victivallales bacterium]
MATFKFRCVFCRQKIEAKEEWLGMFAECPSCHRQIEIHRDAEFSPKIAPFPPPFKTKPPTKL